MMAMAMGVAFPQRGGTGKGTPAPLDAGVLARCRAQDPMAFRAFVVRYERMVFALLSRMLGPRGAAAEVEDLAQEAFVRAYRAFPSFDPGGPAKVSTWLLTIAMRLALDARKKKRVEHDASDPGEAERAAASARAQGTPEAAVERRELGRAIAEAAMTLPDDQRAALVLAEMHGLSIAEIAEALDVPENTAKTRLFRAREKMREALRAEWRTS
jgi:RNA polymerase sigma-70 factor (ECF subfamily)